MIKKILYGIVNTISVLVILLAVVVLCVVLMTKPGKTPGIAGYMALRITTGSMEPTLPVDTMIIVKKAEASDIKVNDIISFYSSDPSLDGAVNTHRVVDIIHNGNGSISFVTKGDGNNVADNYDAKDEFLLGRVVASSLTFGKAVRLASNPLIFIPIIIIPLAILLFTNLFKTVKYAKKIAKEEEEAAVREIVEELNRRKKEDTKK